MPTPPDAASAAQEQRREQVVERARIRKAMQKWRKMDETASLLGRGLGRKELIGRVAREVGASQREVNSALKGSRM